jgi:hypothetical protein
MRMQEEEQCEEREEREREGRGWGERRDATVEERGKGYERLICAH